MSSLNVALVLRLVDRLTGPVKRPTDAVRKLGSGALGAAADASRLAGATTTAARAAGDAGRQTGIFGRSLDGAGRRTRAVGDALLTLGRRFRTAIAPAGDLSRAIKTAEDRMSALQGRLTRQALTGGIAGAGATMALAPSVAWGRQLQLLGNTAGFDPAQLDAVRAQIIGLSGPTAQKVEDLTRGLEVLIGKGLAPDKAIASLERVGVTALATGADIDDLSTTTFALIDNMQMAPDQIGRAMDMLAQAGKLGGFELRDMARDFPQLTAAAQALGMKGAEGVATLSTAVQIALKGAGSPSEAANNFANFLAKITAPETVKRFADMGVDLESEFKAAMADGLDPVRWMVERVTEMTDGDQFKMGELFGDMQVLNFLKPMIANLDEFDRMRAQVLTAQGVVDKDAAAMATTSAVALERAQLGWSRLMQGIGKAIDPAIAVVGNALASVATAAAELVESAPGATAAVVGLTGAVVGLRTAWTVVQIGQTGLQLLGMRGAQAAGRVGLLGRMFGLLGRLVIPGAGAVAGAGRLFGWAGRMAGRFGGAAVSLGRVALPLVATGLRAVGMALIANPIGLAVTAIAGAAWLIYDNWSTIRDFLARLWEPIKPAWDAITGWISGLMDRFQIAISSPFDLIKTAFAWSPVGLVMSNWTGIVDVVSGIFGRVWAVVDGAIGRIIDRVGSVGGWIGRQLGIVDDVPPPPPPPSAPAIAQVMRVTADVGAPSAPASKTEQRVYNITINAPPGADGRRLAAEFKAGLEAAERGALYDKE
ncbi:phage tail tape measure protein (plasmid) [Tistrella mobilis]|uniref:phage tail tape measure protein n=1 Tax=Tistrella mobilis TaxID=171437 RepID=UPI003558DB72